MLRLDSSHSLFRFIATWGPTGSSDRDAEIDSVDRREIEAYLIDGTIFDGEVTEHILTVK